MIHYGCPIPTDFGRENELYISEEPSEVPPIHAQVIGENVKVRRFTRYTLGEGIEIEESDFAAEVASMSKG